MSAEEAKTVPEEGKHDIDYADPDQEQQTKKEGLKDVTVVKGTEGEVCIFKARAKLFRWGKDAEGVENWKERGIGNAKLMRNDADKKIRFVMRQEKTLKPVGNFMVQEKPSCDLKEKPGMDGKAWMWVCNDCSDGTDPVLTKLALRLKNKESADSFKA